MAEERIEEANVEAFGAKVNLKSVALNTFLTLATLLGVVAMGVFLWRHETESRDTGKAFVEAIREQTIAVKEQTVAAREQNCLMRFDTKERQERAEFCKQISR